MEDKTRWKKVLPETETYKYMNCELLTLQLINVILVNFTKIYLYASDKIN